MHLVHSNVKNGTLHAGQEHHKVMVLSVLFEDESEQEHIKARMEPKLHPVLDGGITTL
jgi:hypothetical protein